MNNLPLEILEQIALYHHSVYYNLALTVRTFGLYSIDSEVKARAKIELTICKRDDSIITYELPCGLHRLDGPAYKNKNNRCEKWYIDGKLHRVDNPAVIFTNYKGNILYEAWYKEGKLYNVNGIRIE